MQLFYSTHRLDPYQVLPLRARVDIGAMAVKGCPAFPKAPVSLEPHHQIVWCHIEVQSVYSTAPADLAILMN